MHVSKWRGGRQHDMSALHLSHLHGRDGVSALDKVMVSGPNLELKDVARGLIVMMRARMSIIQKTKQKTAFTFNKLESQ